MDSGDELHLLFFPLMSPGHFIPMVDMVRLFSSFPNVHCSLITTPANPITISGVNVIIIPFPDPSVTGLATGQENLATVPASGFITFTSALSHFRDPITTLLRELRPDALISDSLFPWTSAVAGDLQIPRIIFHGAGAFPLYVSAKVLSQFPIQTPSFSISGQPHEIHLHRDFLPELFSNFDMLRQLGEAEFTSYGVVINTFYEMEPTYVDYYKTNMKAWCVGPLSAFGRREGRLGEGHEVLSWLDGQPEGSVIYVCFGSLCHFTAAELREIAVGLEKSGERFVWVVRKEFEEDEVKEEEWMPEGFEKRVEGRGVVVRGWVPQVAVLGRAAVGWFVTHCGWNSLQEGVLAGVGLVTWPLFHEQFVNQELVVEVMGVGVRMWEGFRRRRGEEEVVVTAEEIAGVVRKVMGGGEEVEKVKRRAKEYGEKGRRAVEEGGSTFEDVRRLVEELGARRRERMVAGG